MRLCVVVFAVLLSSPFVSADSDSDSDSDFDRARGKAVPEGASRRRANAGAPSVAGPARPPPPPPPSPNAPRQTYAQKQAAQGNAYRKAATAAPRPVKTSAYGSIQEAAAAKNQRYRDSRREIDNAQAMKLAYSMKGPGGRGGGNLQEELSRRQRDDPNFLPGFKVKNTWTNQQGKNNAFAARLSAEGAGKNVIYTHKGTQEGKDWGVNFGIGSKTQQGGAGVGKVHKGYEKNVNALLQTQGGGPSGGKAGTLEEAMRKDIGNNANVGFTGHSKGAGEATIAAKFYADQKAAAGGQGATQLTTFASPKVLTKGARDDMAAKGVDGHNYVNKGTLGNDVVTQVGRGVVMGKRLGPHTYNHVGVTHGDGLVFGPPMGIPGVTSAHASNLYLEKSSQRNMQALAQAPLAQREAAQRQQARNAYNEPQDSDSSELGDSSELDF